ncbi:outer membrane beta-barrel protein [Aequorivita echinoideorum]|uniref:Outer membrane beta-barrel protein n=1 Tax=Aequorivita echinoideorum TaxID=1549647 RepID=A0ABS5S3R5_9FLAO|nr:outer membrane beta-barrel protein [Aequorivita echinoideorum]MBT0607856.1 outer membrane beta-barrel protein [Aequorivita echinoideorum]
MKDKKNIDKIFQERLGKFEATPSPRVWDNIQANLAKDKEKGKVIPLWVKLGGVAALLALFFGVGNFVFNSSEENQPAITVEENNDVNSENILKNNSEIDADTSNDVKIASEVETTPLNGESEGFSNNKSSEKNASNNDDYDRNSIVDPASSKANKNAVAVQNSNRKNTKKGKKENSDFSISENDGVASTSTSKENKRKNYENVDKKSSENFNDNGLIKKENEIQNSKNTIVADGLSEKQNSTGGTEKINSEKSENKKSILDAIAEQNGEKEKDENEKPTNRWMVSPNVAPVYYSSLGNGSSIDPDFADNSQSGDVNLSYGVQVSYAVNERLSVRTGVSNVNLSYSTSGIDIASGPVAFALNSVDYGGRGTIITAVDKGAIMEGVPGGNDFGLLKTKSTAPDARLIQNINYYEVPVELKYAFLDSKFGVNVIGGLSTLFLGDNDISVRAGDFNSVLGEANNLSTISFTTNVGLGLDYKFSRKFTFNIEPMFKYQLNPYTDSSVNFRPYYLGVYSGFSFRF